MTLTSPLPRIEEHRVSVVFDCPHCRAERVRGTAYDLRETVRVAERLPRWGWSSHWVRCSHCRAELYSKVCAEDMQGASPTTVNERVWSYQPLTKRFLAIASLMMSWTPVIGVILAIVATFANVKTRGWPRWVSVIGLVLAAGFNLAMFGIVFYMHTQIGTPLSQQ